MLREWVKGCPHTQSQTWDLPWIAEGSEHTVFLDALAGDVVKLTRPGTFGEYYEIAEGRVSEFDSVPGEYLYRLRAWGLLFENAPEPLGLTEAGQIVTRQRFTHGTLPAQSEVDSFLLRAGMQPVRQKLWIWKRTEADLGVETWVGDARADNFVATPTGLVPIDIRLWEVDL